MNTEKDGGTPTWSSSLDASREDNREEALIALPGAISRYLGYLRSKGVKRGGTASGLRFVEEMSGIPELGEAGGGEQSPCLDPTGHQWAGQSSGPSSS